MAKTERDTGRRSAGTYISPEPAVGSSSLQNVLGFIQDYIPQSYYTGTGVNSTHKDPTVLWAKFESIEHNDFNSFIKVDPFSPPPLLLFTGHTYGFTLWIITPNGDASELYSSLNNEEGPVKLATLLPSPLLSPSNDKDTLSNQRPIIALVRKGSTSYRPAYSTVLFVSLKEKGVVKRVEFERNSIIDVQCNAKAIVIVLQKRIVLLDANTLEKKWIVKTGYQKSELWSNPVAMGTRWLAISDDKIHTHLLSVGGVYEDFSPPVASTVVSTVKKGLSALSETWSGITGNKQVTSAVIRTSMNTGDGSPPVVTILDLDYIHSQGGEVCIEELRKADGIIAHFVSHTSTDAHITMMKFNQSGDLLFSADSEGQCFNVYHISPSVHGSIHCKVHHLYSLYRGSTTGIVQDVSFSNDSRWIAISTRNNTTHVFPISPYGGPITVRTHRYLRVVNQLSRYHTSAGIQVTDDNNKRPPLTITPLHQIKAPYLPSTKGVVTSSEEGTIDPVCVRSIFAPPFEISTNSLKNIDFTERKVEYSLYILGGDGSVTEYLLEPIKGGVVNNEPGSTAEEEAESNVELLSNPKLTWKLLSKPIESDYNCFDESPSLLSSTSSSSSCKYNQLKGGEEWLSQVELLTYAPPTRRLWMGPQFNFKTITQKREEEEEEEEGKWVGSPRAVLPPCNDYMMGHNVSMKSVAMTIGGRRDESETRSSSNPNSLDEGVEVFGSWNDVAPRLKGDTPDLELLIHDAMTDDNISLLNEQTNLFVVNTTKMTPYFSSSSLSHT